MAALLLQSWHCLAGTLQMKQKHCAPGSSASVGALQNDAALARRRQEVSANMSSSAMHMLGVQGGQEHRLLQACRLCRRKHTGRKDRIEQCGRAWCARCCRQCSCPGTPSWRTGARCTAGAHGARLGPTSVRAQNNVSVAQEELQCCAAILQQSVQPLLRQHSAPSKGQGALRSCTCKSQCASATKRTRLPPAAPLPAKRVAPAGGLRCTWNGRAALSACGSRTWS